MAAKSDVRAPDSRWDAGGVALEAILGAIQDRRAACPPSRALLVALSGIDGSGKGFVAQRIARALERRGVGVASFNVDGWLNLPAVRFSAIDPAAHFYAHAIRFDEMFAQLVVPLRRDRRIHLEADAAEETATQFHERLYAYENVDVILVEGIYLLKRALRPQYDLALWLDCSFETALERALSRGQEGLSAAEATHAYETIYFPAQEIHFQRDAPREAADRVLSNDARITEPF